MKRLEEAPDWTRMRAAPRGAAPGARPLGPARRADPPRRDPDPCAHLWLVSRLRLNSLDPESISAVIGYRRDRSRALSDSRPASSNSSRSRIGPEATLRPFRSGSDWRVVRQASCRSQATRTRTGPNGRVRRVGAQQLLSHLLPPLAADQPGPRVRVERRCSREDHIATREGTRWAGNPRSSSIGTTRRSGGSESGLSRHHHQPLVAHRASLGGESQVVPRSSLQFGGRN
jgi:hypothetical protein